MKKSFLSLAAGSAALLFVLALAPPLSAAPTPAVTGRIVFTDGEVKADGREVETGALLSGTVVLKTGAESAVEVEFGGRNIFRLGPDTVARVDFGSLKRTVVLERGIFTSVLKKLAKLTGTASFGLRTPTINAGVRGTSFHVEVTGDRTYFCTCNGGVDLDRGTPAETISLVNAHHGSRIFTRLGDGSVSVTPGGLEGHTDASIETLAARIGVAVDWTKPDLDHE